MRGQKLNIFRLVFVEPLILKLVRRIGWFEPLARGEIAFIRILLEDPPMARIDLIDRLLRIRYARRKADAILWRAR